jgi:predicted ABC-type ATPase
VFSHRSKLEVIGAAIDAGYDVVLHVVMIPLELSGPRVAARVAAGGHSVPARKLAARYERLWPNVAAAVPQCHRIVFWDNAADEGPDEVAAFRHGVPDYPPRWPTWTPEPITARPHRL